MISSSIAVSITTPIYLFFNPTFNMEEYPMSYLGTGPYGSGLIFSIGMIISGLSLIPFYYSLSDLFRENHSIMIKYIPKIAFISLVGLVLLGLFPFEETNTLSYSIHGFVSTIYFIGMSVVYFCFWLIELKAFKYYNYLTVISFITSFINGTFWIGGVIREYKILDIPSLNYSIQWYGFIISTVWTLVHALFSYHNKE